jgi:hypothetical protein
MAIAIIAARKWILELCSFFSSEHKPLNANLKLPNRFFSENLSGFICK